MSSLSPFPPLTRRVAMLALGAAALMTLAGCAGFTPVYSDQSAASRMALHFADPTNPLEQIVYQDLARHFGMSDDPSAPQVSVAVSTASRDLAQSTTTDPTTPELVTATGLLRISRNGQNVLTASRQATATYSTAEQGVGDSSAEQGAEQQAAHALASTLELTIISALAPTTPQQ